LVQEDGTPHTALPHLHGALPGGLAFGALPRLRAVCVAAPGARALTPRAWQTLGLCRRATRLQRHLARHILAQTLRFWDGSPPFGAARLPVLRFGIAGRVPRQPVIGCCSCSSRTHRAVLCLPAWFCLWPLFCYVVLLFVLGRCSSGVSGSHLTTHLAEPLPVPDTDKARVYRCLACPLLVGRVHRVTRYHCSSCCLFCSGHSLVFRRYCRRNRSPRCCFHAPFSCARLNIMRWRRACSTTSSPSGRVWYGVGRFIVRPSWSTGSGCSRGYRCSLRLAVH